jgi:hypothetical protein
MPHTNGCQERADNPNYFIRILSHQIKTQDLVSPAFCLQPIAAASAALRPLACEISSRKKRSEFHRALISALLSFIVPHPSAAVILPPSVLPFALASNLQPQTSIGRRPSPPSSKRSDHPSSLVFFLPFALASNLQPQTSTGRRPHLKRSAPPSAVGPASLIRAKRSPFAHRFLFALHLAYLPRRVEFKSTI